MTNFSEELAAAKAKRDQLYDHLRKSEDPAEQHRLQTELYELDTTIAALEDADAHRT